MLRPPSVLAALWCLAAAGCASSVPGDGSSTAGAETVGGDGGGGAAAGSEHDLFACGVAPQCAFDMGHGIWEIPSESATRCAVELMGSDDGGAVLVVSAPGPGLNDAETLYVLRGDGTAYVQHRGRCREAGNCGHPAMTWTRAPLELCRIAEPDAAVIAACQAPEAGGGGGDVDGEGGAAPGTGAGGGMGGPAACSWVPQGVDCVAVSPGWSCEALAPAAASDP